MSRPIQKECEKWAHCLPQTLHLWVFKDPRDDDHRTMQKYVVPDLVFIRLGSFLSWIVYIFAIYSGSFFNFLTFRNETKITKYELTKFVICEIYI